MGQSSGAQTHGACARERAGQERDLTVWSLLVPGGPGEEGRLPRELAPAPSAVWPPPATPDSPDGHSEPEMCVFM